MASDRQQLDRDGRPRLEHADGGRVDRQVRRPERDTERGIVQGDGGPGASSDAGETPHEGRRGARRTVPDDHVPGAGLEAREDHRMGGPASPGDDHRGAVQRATHRQLHAGPEAGCVAVEAEQLPVVAPDHVVDRADRVRLGLDLVAQPGHQRACTAR